jgi:peptidyl-prolyl cis-trans isomerase A (cyclophilin A)
MDNDVVQVAIETVKGIIEIEIAKGRAPITSANFLRYVDEGFYNKTSFYRIVTLSNQPNDMVKIEVIQGGPGVDHLIEEKAKYPPIKLERTSLTGLKHLDGTISMARLGTNSATSEFFICINDQPELDFGGKRYADGQGFAAFGQVVRGQNVVRQIQQAQAEGQNLTPPISILSIRRLD